MNFKVSKLPVLHPALVGALVTPNYQHWRWLNQGKHNFSHLPDDLRVGVISPIDEGSDWVRVVWDNEDTDSNTYRTRKEEPDLFYLHPTKYVPVEEGDTIMPLERYSHPSVVIGQKYTVSKVISYPDDLTLHLNDNTIVWACSKDSFYITNKSYMTTQSKKITGKATYFRDTNTLPVVGAPGIPVDSRVLILGNAPYKDDVYLVQDKSGNTWFIHQDDLTVEETYPLTRAQVHNIYRQQRKDWNTILDELLEEQKFCEQFLVTESLIQKALNDHNICEAWKNQIREWTGYVPKEIPFEPFDLTIKIDSYAKAYGWWVLLNNSNATQKDNFEKGSKSSRLPLPEFKPLYGVDEWSIVNEQLNKYKK